MKSSIGHLKDNLCRLEEYLGNAKEGLKHALAEAEERRAAIAQYDVHIAEAKQAIAILEASNG